MSLVNTAFKEVKLVWPRMSRRHAKRMAVRLVRGGYSWWQ